MQNVTFFTDPKAQQAANNIKIIVDAIKRAYIILSEKPSSTGIALSGSTSPYSSISGCWFALSENNSKAEVSIPLNNIKALTGSDYHQLRQALTATSESEEDRQAGLEDIKQQIATYFETHTDTVHLKDIDHTAPARLVIDISELNSAKISAIELALKLTDLVPQANTQQRVDFN